MKRLMLVAVVVAFGACTQQRQEGVVAPSLGETGFAQTSDVPHGLGQCNHAASVQLCHANRNYSFTEQCVVWHLEHHPADYRGLCQ